MSTGSTSPGAEVRLGIAWPGRPPTPLEESDLRAFLPQGVAMTLVAPDPPRDPPRATLERVLYLANSDEIERLAGRLIGSGSVAVAYACGTASYVGGFGGDRRISERIEKRCGAPATTTSTEMVAALRELNARHVSVLSPHIDSLNERLVTFLAAADIEVVRMHGLGLTSGIENTSPSEVIDLASAADDTRASAIYIACTSLQTAKIVDLIEHKIGKPVVTANQATMWGLLRMANACQPRSDRGCLFRSDAIALAVGPRSISDNRQLRQTR